jgi:hypothetical protein
VSVLKSVNRGALEGFGGTWFPAALCSRAYRLSRAKIAAGGNPPSIAPAAITASASSIAIYLLRPDRATRAPAAITASASSIAI